MIIGQKANQTHIVKAKRFFIASSLKYFGSGFFFQSTGLVLSQRMALDFRHQQKQKSSHFENILISYFISAD